MAAVLLTIHHIVQFHWFSYQTDGHDNHPYADKRLNGRLHFSARLLFLPDTKQRAHLTPWQRREDLLSAVSAVPSVLKGLEGQTSGGWKNTQRQCVPFPFPLCLFYVHSPLF